MPELSSIDDLRLLRSRVQEDTRARPANPCLVVCAGTACQASGANSIQRMIKSELLQRELTDRISLRITGCHGFCEMGPFVLTEPQNALYVKLKRQDIPRIIDAVLQNEYVEDLLYRDPASGKVCYHQDEIPFYARQQRSILGQNQRIDPIRILQYVANGGYLALEHVLENPKPEWVLEEVKKSEKRF